MQILKEYLVCDGLYREIDDIEIRCKLNQASIDLEICQALTDRQQLNEVSV